MTVENLITNIRNDSETLESYKKEINDYSKKYKVDVIDLAASFLRSIDESNLKSIRNVKLNNKFHKDEGKIETKRINKIYDTKRYFINLGKMDDLDEDSLINVLRTFLPTLKKQDFATVRMLPSYSFFEVKENLGSAILNNISNAKFNNRQINCEISNGREKDPISHKKPKTSKDGAPRKRTFNSRKPANHKHFN